MTIKQGMIQGAMCGSLNSFFSYACSLCVLWRGGLPPNNANSTLELKSVDLKLKAIKPNLLDHMN